jgi:hypothetical protein
MKTTIEYGGNASSAIAPEKPFRVTIRPARTIAVANRIVASLTKKAPEVPFSAENVQGATHIHVGANSEASVLPHAVIADIAGHVGAFMLITPEAA